MPAAVAAASSTPPSARLPFEIVASILTFAILAPPDLHEREDELDRPPRRRPPAYSHLLISSTLRKALEPIYYSRVTLTSTNALASFASTLKSRPDLNRKVKSLWIAPSSLSSDFITTLKPPSDGINSLPATIAQPITHIKAILRACRSLRHLALDGCLCTLKASTLFGSNCQPLSVTSINPYSFLGGFSAPMFKKVRRLELCDTSLASDEVEQVRTLPELGEFVWTSPREYGDAKRDVTALWRIVAPGSGQFSRPSTTLQAAVEAGGEEGEQRGEGSSSPLPVKPHAPRHLRSVTIRSGQTRCAQLATALKLAIADPALQHHQHHASTDELASSLSSSLASLSLGGRGGVSAPYVDSSAHTTRIEHPGTGVEMCTARIEGDAVAGQDDDDGGGAGLIDEWEALRDIICPGGGGASLSFRIDEANRGTARRKREKLQGPATSDEDEDEGRSESVIDPGMALRRLWVEWCTRVEDGSLEVELGSRR
ncbi:hypothetical protein BDZ90DRAFT_232484 [Jaminaea rosea]|uniref:Uncharacterized protein n=1 Tax=Jaminaea rosea TaxID=1569628 RepID=A0A316URB7_9BASI|nr:hypothetical protein BDZ90DRAFT_232484 [Jaminaea rosea]PWN27514.1 hypothetical protein BDZ90DRAFT_232484 [Jaminaea rosea]